ncbi:cell division protein FtsQ/DivIB [Wenzhouxiangella limi]|uniref:Cell division protein FtsQ n=1 Tax=Wenzhouxiangella limi TaxID=2707351 RepID=A0A845V9T3_9GAMM|nr:cell division protein FtsQ/DivIB [Wenzhouxiangella limi]NDY96675.1 FtsQ-type POTRA domain-containing protein [Wenzhouxiangella limi]
MNKTPLLAGLVVVGIVLVAGLWLRAGLIGAERWPVRWLDVEGELHRTSAGQIRSAAVGPASTGFFATDLDAVRGAVEALPWVAAATVGRHWPDALHIRVVEHRPVARWNEDRLLSDQGKVFEVSGSSSMQGMASLEGPEARREEVLENWRLMRRRLAAVGQDINHVRLDERGAWTVRLDSGQILALGRESVHERLERYVLVHDELRARGRPIARVDLRYTNGLSVRWADEAGPEVAQRG